MIDDNKVFYGGEDSRHGSYTSNYLTIGDNGYEYPYTYTNPSITITSPAVYPSFTTSGVTVYCDPPKKEKLIHRVFYIDVRNIPIDEISNYIDSVKEGLRETSQKISSLKEQGLWVDLFIPVRENSRIDIREIEL